MRVAEVARRYIRQLEQRREARRHGADGSVEREAQVGEAGRGIMAEIAGRGPELIDVVRVEHRHHRCDLHEVAAVELFMIPPAAQRRSEEHTSELQSLMRISYAVFCLKKKTKVQNTSP